MSNLLLRRIVAVFYVLTLHFHFMYFSPEEDQINGRNVGIKQNLVVCIVLLTELVRLKYH